MIETHQIGPRVKKKKKRERKVKGHFDDVQHKGNGTVDGEGQV